MYWWVNGHLEKHSLTWKMCFDTTESTSRCVYRMCLMWTSNWQIWSCQRSNMHHWSWGPSTLKSNRWQPWTHVWQSLLGCSFIGELMSVSSPLVCSFCAANTVCSVCGRWGGRTTCPPVFSVFFPLISLHSTKMSPFSNSFATSSNWRESLWVHLNVPLLYLQKIIEAVMFLCDAVRRCTVCELRSSLLLVNSTVAVVYFANWRCS